MSEMQKIYYFKWSSNEAVGKCGLEIYRGDDGRAVVIMTELDDNPGPSITTYAETLATLILAEYDLEPSRTIWFEHYPILTEKYKDVFDLQNFVWIGRRATDLEWRSSSRAEMQAALKAIGAYTTNMLVNK